MPTVFAKRSTSPLQFEPLEPYDVEILYPGSDLEETYDERKSKRRRIEAAGCQYLKGRQLFILSAQLKGPFGDGWVNPWARAPKSREIEDTLDRRIQDRSVDTDGGQDHEIADEDPQYSQDSFVTTASLKGQSKDHVVQQNNKGWLKSRDDALYSRHGPKSRSPTPTPKPKSFIRSDGAVQIHSEVDIVSTRHRAPMAFNTTRLSNDQSKGPSAHNVSSEAKHASDTMQHTEEPHNMASNTAMVLEKPSKVKRKLNRISTRVLPPLTYQPEFQYRFGSKRSSRSLEKSSLTDEHNPTKEKAVAEAKSKSSFAALEGLKGNQVPQQNFDRKKAGSPPKDTSVDERGELPASYLEEKQNSGDSYALPEAQIVKDPAGQLPSGPSTDLLETDKKSSKSIKSPHDGYNRYTDLSTQAALAKVQQSFQESISPNTSPKLPNPSLKQVNEPGQKSTTTIKDLIVEARALKKSPAGVSDEPMNTQAIVDAISPFPKTTVKKRTSFARSPSRATSTPSPLNSEFRTKSLSMSTSPSPPPVQNDEPRIPISALSKPPSTITSFSIGPNGSLTEVFQQEGQQQNFNMENWDLDAAIEEAGSFLGEWDLEAEARKEGQASLGSKENTNTNTTKRGAFSNRSKREI